MGAGSFEHDESYVYEPWYKYGIMFLFFEAAIAVGVTIYSLSMAFSGQAVQFKKKVVFEKKPAVEAPAPPVAQQCAAIQQQLEDCLKAAGAKTK
ncbi:MAG TPA: hypothetical protein ENI99_07035 [Sedimenticola sp.]|nr:hypothetical protein [Sedimenticola sp.]